MALRLFSKEEFEQELKESWNLSPTNEGGDTFTLWHTSKGHYITVPKLPESERYPDYVLDGIIKQLETLESSLANGPPNNKP